MRNLAQYPITSEDVADAVRKAAPDINMPDPPIGGVSEYALDIALDFIKDHSDYFNAYARARRRGVQNPSIAYMTVNRKIDHVSGIVTQQETTLHGIVIE